MHSEFRAFKKAFLDRMRNDTAWPAKKLLFEAIRGPVGGSIRNEQLSRLVAGEAVPQQAAFFVIEAMLRRDMYGYDPFARTRETVLAFLTEQNVAKPAELSFRDALDVLCDPPVRREVANDTRSDFLLRGLGTVLNLFGTKRLVTRHAQRCSTEDDVKKGVLWAMVWLGRALTPARPALPVERAVQLAQSRLGISLGDNQERIIELWRLHPWTVVFARGRDQQQPAGFSVMLPLSSDAYAKLTCGQRSCFHCDAADFEIPCRHLFVEIVIERPADLGGGPLEDATKSLIRCCIAQTAVLSRCSDYLRDEAISFLSFAPSALSKSRLEASGYKASGKVMAETQIPLMQRRLLPRSAKTHEFGVAAALYYLSGVLVDPPEP